MGVQTNAHVIAEALPGESGGAAPERPIICTLQDGRIFEGTLAGYDRWILKHVIPRGVLAIGAASEKCPLLCTVADWATEPRIALRRVRTGKHPQSRSVLNLLGGRVLDLALLRILGFILLGEG